MDGVGRGNFLQSQMNLNSVLNSEDMEVDDSRRYKG